MKDTSFTPNTITYTPKGDVAKKVKRSKIGVVVHTQYHGSDFNNLKATHNTDHHKTFKNHPDVHHHGVDHDTSNINYSEKSQKEFHSHMSAAQAIHDKHGKHMYKHTERHQGHGGHLTTYINHTVRHGSKPSSAGFHDHVRSHNEKKGSKLKSEKHKAEHNSRSQEEHNHIKKHSKHYDNLFKMHHHLTQAKHILVKHLESHEGDYEHSINGKKSKPEGFVIQHRGMPTKLVNRHEFAKANFEKNRK